MVARLLPNRRKMRPRSCRNEVAVSLSRKRGGSQEAHLVHSGHLAVQPGTAPGVRFAALAENSVWTLSLRSFQVRREGPHDS